MKKDYDELNMRFINTVQEKNEQEEHFDNKIKGFKISLEQR